MQFDGLLDGYQRARDGISAAAAAVEPIARAATFLAKPSPVFGIAEQRERSGIASVMSTVNSIVDVASSVTEATRVVADWKPTLMRLSPPLEAAFTMRLPVIEQMLYFTIRPEILSVADQLSRAFELPSQNTFVDYMGTLFELDFDLYIDPDLDLDVPLADGPPVAAPQKPRPVILRELVVWLADRPLVVRIVGVVVGEAAGTGTGVMIDGAVGALIGNAGGAGLGLALGEGLVVVVKRCRNRL